jgi:hypothetical protein
VAVNADADGPLTLTGILLAGKCVKKLREEGMFAAIIGMALRAASALCLAVGLLIAPARPETLDELYTKAKTEKSLVIYAGGPVSNYAPLAREFESKFPGLTVSIEGGFSNVLNQKIERQFSDQRLEADMALFQTAQDFVRWKGQGKCSPSNRKASTPSTSRSRIPTARSSSGTWACRVI